MIDLTPEPSAKTTEIELTQGPNGSPRAEASCDSGRLDDPQGAYSFANVQVRRAPELGGTLDVFEASFDDSWRGAGVPSVHECTLTAYDASGNTLFEHPFTFSDGMGNSEANFMHLITPEPIVVDPATASIDCLPFG